MTEVTDPSRLHRSDAPDTSVAAAHAVDVKGLEKVVYDTLRSSSKAMISDEIRQAVRIEHGIDSYSSVTARFKSLHEKGLLDFTGNKRPGQSGRLQREMFAR